MRNLNRDGEWAKRMYVSQADGRICTAPSILLGIRSLSCSRLPAILLPQKVFLQLAIARVGPIQPRVINVDGHAASPAAVADLQQSGVLNRRCRCRCSPYMNNVVEQDHRYVRKRVAASQWFRSGDGALNTIAAVKQ